jgi:superfamily I DNA/RNA helicase
MGMYELRASLFNPPQLSAVLHRDGPVLVLAGAGSGKTRVIAHRIAHLVSTGVEPSQIVALSFTNKAAAEMRSRVAELMGPQLAKQSRLSTFHSLGVEILRRDIEALGLRNPFAILDGSDQKQVLRELLKELKLKGTKLDLDEILSLISRAKMAFSPAHQMPKMRFHPLRPIIRRVAERYEQSLRSLNAVDFDDLITLPVKLFQAHPQILARYHQAWRYLLVDEYQDTNHGQFVLLELLARGHGNVMVVGDDDQSIYAFRGAVAEHILGFEQHFPGARVIALEQNYRSTKNILEAANGVIGASARRRDKTLWTAGEQGEPVRQVLCRDEQEEAQFVARQLERLRVEQGRAYASMAILYRSNPQSRVFEESLRLHRIPYRIIGGTRFYDRQEIREVVAYLRLCHAPQDDLAIRRIINVPPRGVGPALIAKVDELARGQSCSFVEALRRMLKDEAAWQGVRQSELVRERVRQLLQVMERFRIRFASAEPLSTVARAMLVELGYFEHLRNEASEEMALRRIDNASELLEALAQFEASGSGRLSSFLERVALEPPEKDSEQDEGVTLMTLHGAKGLEFDVVFLVGCEEGLLPHARALEELGGVEEERRLCYVGITRARQCLSISACRTRTRHGEAMPCSVSRFLADIPEACIERPDADTAASRELASLQRERDQGHLEALRKAIFERS